MQYPWQCLFKGLGSSRHSKTHTNNKQYQCNFCDTAFLRKCALLRHIKTHSVINTGDKPFQCNYCKKAFF